MCMQTISQHKKYGQDLIAELRKAAHLLSEPRAIDRRKNQPDPSTGSDSSQAVATDRTACPTKPADHARAGRTGARAGLASSGRPPGHIRRPAGPSPSSGSCGGRSRRSRSSRVRFAISNGTFDQRLYENRFYRVFNLVTVARSNGTMLTKKGHRFGTRVHRNQPKFLSGDICTGQPEIRLHEPVPQRGCHDCSRSFSSAAPASAVGLSTALESSCKALCDRASLVP